MGEASTINGDMPSSQFLSHLTSYPLISDSITTFKQNPYGAKSLSLTDTVYAKFAKPFLPYFETPYSFVAPYVAKADELGNFGLSKIDEKFPVVKTETEQVKSTVLDYAFFPVKFAGDSKDYLFNTYGTEYKKCGGEGVVAGGKALITTGLVVSSDTLSYLSQLFSAKKEQAKEYAKEKSDK